MAVTHLYKVHINRVVHYIHKLTLFIKSKRFEACSLKNVSAAFRRGDTKRLVSILIQKYKNICVRKDE